MDNKKEYFILKIKSKDIKLYSQKQLIQPQIYIKESTIKK